MRVRISINPIRSSTRRPLAAVALVAYLVTWLGFPLPMPPVAAAEEGKSTEEASEPYPCQNCHCGCTSAAQCWQHCCCFTMSERIAWAREHHVTPPEWVQEMPEYQAALAESAKLLPATCPSCRAGAASCSTHNHEHTHCNHCDAGSTNCTSGHCDHDENSVAPAVSASPAAKPAAKKESARRWLILLESQRCGGVNLLWVASGAALPTPLPSPLTPDTTVRSFRPLLTLLYAAVAHQPPVPPPQVRAL